MIGMLALALAAASADTAPLAAAAPLDLGPLQRCDPPPGWNAVVKRGTRFVVFGEVHGSVEAPALVGDVACTLAFDGERVLVGVELNATDDAALQAAWKLPDDRFAAALARIGWAGRRDGVASRAMAALLLRLHRLSAGGRVVDVVAFDGLRDADQARRFASLPGQGPHEAAQAENIRLTDAGRYDHVLVLVGTLHAGKQPMTSGATTFEPMAMRLSPRATLTSLLMREGGGTIWNCLSRPGSSLTPGTALPAATSDCGVHPAVASAALAGPAPSLGLGTAPGAMPDPAYDGWFWLGRITASPPFRPAAPGLRR